MTHGMSMALSLGGIAFALTVIWGGPLLRILRHLRVGKQIRLDGPRSHQTKLGTPTMGGLMIVIPVFLITLLLNTVPILGRSLLGPLDPPAARRDGGFCHVGRIGRLARIAQPAAACA